jgi:calcyclin binding protein
MQKGVCTRALICMIVRRSSQMKSKAPESSDPQAGLMNMMKQMYDDGDDEMKRTIKKTWFESQQKKGPGSAPFEGM